MSCTVCDRSARCVACAFPDCDADKLAAPSIATTANPLEPGLRSELDSYFRPFQTQLRKVLANHKKCVIERTKERAMRKRATMQGAALARAG